jgi:hypothetical protein
LQVSHGDPTIHITTTNRGKLTLKLANTVEVRISLFSPPYALHSPLYLTRVPLLVLLQQMHKWLFCFQKSVALVLTHLMRSAENRSPAGQSQGPDSFGKGGRPKNAMPSPEKGGLSLRHPDHNASTGWMGPQSMIPGVGGYLNEDSYAAFRRNGSREITQRGGGRGDADGRFEFRHSDGVDSPSKIPGSTAIPIQAPKSGTAAHGHVHGHHAAHSHHSIGQQAQLHSRSRAHSNQSHGQRSISQDGYSSASGRNESIDRLATSYKEEDDERPRLTDLLQTPSDGTPRSRGQSEDQQSDESEDGDVHGDWRSKGSNEMQEDDDGEE